MNKKSISHYGTRLLLDIRKVQCSSPVLQFFPPVIWFLLNNISEVSFDVIQTPLLLMPKLTELFLMYLLAAMCGLLFVRVVFLFTTQFTSVNVMGMEEEIDFIVQGVYLNPSNFQAIS